MNGEGEVSQRLYIPAYLNAIGYLQSEGEHWLQWPAHWGVVQSHRLPRGLNDQIGSVTFRSFHIHTIDNHNVIRQVHAILFEKGYIWDSINGFRNVKLDQDTIDSIKRQWFWAE